LKTKPPYTKFDSLIYVGLLLVLSTVVLWAIRLSDPDRDSQWISVQIHLVNRMT